MKRNRHFKTIVCLVLGAVLLTGSVFANYDNASGYTRLKKGLLNLTTVENLTAEASLSMAVNGENLASTSGTMKYDVNGDVSEYHLSEDSTDDSKYESWTQNGFNISKNTYADDVNYYVYGVTEEKGFNYEYINGSEDEKDMRQKELDFLELFADTLVGDLKNNFVLVSSENGVSEYQIDLSRDQIPELIQSGLSLMASSRFSYSYDGQTFYEDWEATAELSDEDSEAQWQEIDNHFMGNNYMGIAYVKADNSIVYYDTYEEYIKAEEIVDERDAVNQFFYNMTDDLALENVKCNASVDSDGNINSITASVDFSATNKNGEKQTLTISGEAKLYDYGKTTIEAFDQSILSLDWENAKNSNNKYYDFDGNGKLIQYDESGVAISPHVYEEGAYTEDAIVEDDASADDAA